MDVVRRFVSPHTQASLYNRRNNRKPQKDKLLALSKYANIKGSC